jgi:hypothetical protein
MAENEKTRPSCPKCGGTLDPLVGNAGETVYVCINHGFAEPEDTEDMELRPMAPAQLRAEVTAATSREKAARRAAFEEALEKWNSLPFGMGLSEKFTVWLRKKART